MSWLPRIAKFAFVGGHALAEPPVTWSVTAVWEVGTAGTMKTSFWASALSGNPIASPIARMMRAAVFPMGVRTGRSERVSRGRTIPAVSTPPGPRSVIPFRYLRTLQRDPIPFFGRIANEYGDAVQF